MDRFTVKVELVGCSLEFRGTERLYEETLRPALASLAAGRWREASSAPSLAPPAGPALAVAPEPAASAPVAPAPRAFPPAPPPARAEAPPASPAPAPSSRPTGSSGLPTSLDPRGIYARIASQEGRRGEKDAVLTALVFLALEGKRDAGPSDVLGHLLKHGFPTSALKPKPILLKFAARTSFVVPGVLHATFRATPQGAAHVQEKVLRR